MEHQRRRKTPKAALDTREAAVYLSVSESWLKNGRWLGYGPPYVRLGRMIRYQVQALDEYLEENQHPSAGAA